MEGQGEGSPEPCRAAASNATARNARSCDALAGGPTLAAASRSFLAAFLCSRTQWPRKTRCISDAAPCLAASSRSSAFLLSRTRWPRYIRCTSDAAACALAAKARSSASMSPAATCAARKSAGRRGGRPRRYVTGAARSGAVELAEAFEAGLPQLLTRKPALAISFKSKPPSSSCSMEYPSPLNTPMGNPT